MQARDFAPLPKRITFTVDLEDHAGGGDGAPRYPAMTRRILAFLAERKVQATFFIVGDVAERTPALVREIAGAGARDRVPLAPAPTAHRRTTRRGSGASSPPARAAWRTLPALPSSASGRPCSPSCRGPPGRSTCWPRPGFAYSSSIIPARSFGFGWAGAPAAPFRWPNGLLELPCPVGRVGFFPLPFLGGMYLRYLPPWRLRQASRTRSTDMVWTYCHPYDFDADEPFRRLPGPEPASQLLPVVEPRPHPAPARHDPPRPPDRDLPRPAGRARRSASPPHSSPATVRRAA